MRTVRDSCQLQDNALDIRVSDEITQLDQAIADEGTGRAFFERTHVTDGLRTLMNEGLARLGGKSSQAIFHLKQAMGGGKTHLLTALGLLSRHPSLRKEVCPDLHARFPFGSARVAAFNGRNRPNEYFWGEIAKQIGKPEQFARYWTNGPDAPDEKAWTDLLGDGNPTLILLDELPPYFDYYVQKEMGGGTVANVMTYALATLFTASAKLSNVCVIVSDLSASYEGGGRVINKALDDARQEVGRQEKTITPVDLAGNEIYEIMRKKLFRKLPDVDAIAEISESYGKALSEAGKSQTVPRSAESLAEEIAQTYPFHPRLKNLIALFKENEKFRQTRGLMELVSRLLRSVWERDANDVYLVGAQHFNFAIPDVRDAFERIGSLRDVMARDLWDEASSAHAQVIDLNAGDDYAAQVGSLVFTSSLSTAVNAVKGLTRSEVLECLISPFSDAVKYATALDRLHSVSWHMHKTTDDRFYFDPQENLGRMLQSYAEGAPENQIEQLKRNRLEEIFRPRTQAAYQRVLALPTLDAVTEEARRQRVLIIVEPDSKIPPEKVAKFFADLPWKNNLCVLTGDRTEMAKLDAAARMTFAVAKAAKRIDLAHPQHGELERRTMDTSKDFSSTVQALFDKVLRPVSKGGVSELRPEPLDTSRDGKEEATGERQIERTLASDRVGKLILDIEGDQDTIRSKAEALLWQSGETRARWVDIVEQSQINTGFFWLPPKGLETIKRLAVEKGKWEDEGNGWVNKTPPKKRTSAIVSVVGEMNDQGKTRIQVTAVHAGPAPQVHFADRTPVTNADPKLTELAFDTEAMRLHFLVIDPSGQFETGEPKTWENKIRIVCSNEQIKDGKRTVELRALPRGSIRYTLDGSEPRDGKDYQGPVNIGTDEARLLVFADADGIEAKQTLTFPKLGGGDDTDGADTVDQTKPCAIVKRLDWGGRAEAWKAIEAAKANKATLLSVRLTLGDGDRSATVSFGSDLKTTPEAIEAALAAVQTILPPDATLALSARRVEFSNGHELKVFAAALGLALKRNEVSQT